MTAVLPSPAAVPAASAVVPPSVSLSAMLSAIVARKNNFIDEDLIARLSALRPKDIDALSPPSIMAAGGLWVGDAGFCRRLGAVLFDVSDETVDDLSVRDYQIFLAVVSANFTEYMERSIP